MTTLANMATYILISVRTSRAIGQAQLMFGNFVPTWEQARLANKVTLETFTIDPITGECFCPQCEGLGPDDDVHGFDGYDAPWEPNEFGVTQEDMNEFYARNIERGTPYGYWY